MAIDGAALVFFPILNNFLPLEKANELSIYKKDNKIKIEVK